MKLTKITTLIAAFGVLGFVGVAISAPAYAAPACTGIDCVSSGADTAKTGGANTSNITDIIKNVTNVLMFILGAISVIMMIVGGIKYTTSNGNAEQVKSAKNTIMYAIVGLVVAIFGYAIVRFVIDRLT